MKALILAAAAFVAVIGSARAESGIASHYSTRELGTRTASGRPLHDGALTAAIRQPRACHQPCEWPQCGGYDYRPGAVRTREGDRPVGRRCSCARILRSRPRLPREDRESFVNETLLGGNS